MIHPLQKPEVGGEKDISITLQIKKKQYTENNLTNLKLGPVFR